MTSSVINIVLINQFGASKPPWVEKYLFYKLPFNYCDRWCERCRLSGICRVYQIEKEKEKRFIKKGIDPKSANAMFLSIRESFEEVKRMLEIDMKRLKITITEEESKKFDVEEEKKDLMVNSDKLTQLARKLCFQLVKIAEDLHYYFAENTPNELEEPLTILRYYMHFFYVKIHRAVNSEVEEKEMTDEDTTFDSKNSAFLSYISIIKIINALKVISQNKNIKSSLNQKVKKLIPLFEDLNIVLEKRFYFDLE